MKILVTDDHALFREGLRYVLMQLEHDVQVLEAGDCDAAIHIARSHRDLNLILLDLAMDGLQGIDSFNLLRAHVPHVPIVIVSASEDRALVQQTLDHGAHGYIPKSSTGKTMVNALHVVLSGGIYLPPTILDTQENPHIEVGSPVHVDPEAKAEPPDRQSSLGLTLRQLDVLSLLCKGMPNKAICRILEISEGTVKRHVTEILRKLNVSNRTQAVMTAQALGISVDSD